LEKILFKVNLGYKSQDVTAWVCNKRLLDAGMQPSVVQGSVMAASRMDNSYVVLSLQNRSQGPGIPPRPPSASAAHNDLSQSTRAIDGSYIVLPPPAASIYKTSASEGSGAQQPPPGGNSSSPSPGNNSGFHSSVTVLKRAFEIATSQTQVAYDVLIFVL
jgi:beclin